MSLQPTSFNSYGVADSQIGIIETRLGNSQAYDLLAFNSNGSSQISLSGFNFTVSYQDAFASFLTTNESLISISDLNILSDKKTDPNLTVYSTPDKLALGIATLYVPNSVLTSNSDYISTDGTTTLFKLIKIGITWQSSVTGAYNIQNPLLGFVVRYGF